MYKKKVKDKIKLQSEMGRFIFKKILSKNGKYSDVFGNTYEVVCGESFICNEDEVSSYAEYTEIQEYLSHEKLYDSKNIEVVARNVNSLNRSQIDQDFSIATTEEAVNFLLMGEINLQSIYSKNYSGNINNERGTNMGSYLGNQIYKGKLDYDEVVAKYPQFKSDIDVFLELKLIQDGLK